MHNKVPSPTQVAIIGAGIAGMGAAASLQRAGLDLQVFEKSRGPGGRTSTRRQDELRFDHGTSFFGAKEPQFTEVVQAWIQQGLVGTWTTQQGRLNASGVHPQGAQVFTALPKMSALARAIGQDIACHYATRIESIAPHAQGWELRDSEGQSYLAQRVLLTAPPPQTLALIQSHAPKLRQALEQVEVLPDWTLMLTGMPDLLPEELGWLDFEDHATLARLCAEHKKPQRPGQAAWTLHATGDWSRRYEEQEPEWVAQTLLAELSQALDKPLSFEQVKAHRWRYARTRQQASPAFLSDPSGLCYAGDACLKGDLESAYLSGQAAAQALA